MNMFNLTWKNVAKIHDGDFETDVVSLREQWGIEEKIYKMIICGTIRKPTERTVRRKKTNLKDGRIRKIWEVGEEKKKTILK